MTEMGGKVFYFLDTDLASRLRGDDNINTVYLLKLTD